MVTINIVIIIYGKDISVLQFEKVCYVMLVANSVDPDQSAPKEQSDQGLPCLLIYFW